jgi:hypothetical protein
MGWRTGAWLGRLMCAKHAVAAAHRPHVYVVHVSLPLPDPFLASSKDVPFAQVVALIRGQAAAHLECP